MSTPAPVVTAPTATYEVRHGFRHVAGRGTIGCGFYVVETRGVQAPIVAGPYTTLEQADAKAAELLALTTCRKCGGPLTRSWRDGYGNCPTDGEVGAPGLSAAERRPVDDGPADNYGAW